LKQEDAVSRATLVRNECPPKFISSQPKPEIEPYQSGNHKRYQGSTVHAGHIRKNSEYMQHSDHKLCYRAYAQILNPRMKPRKQRTAF
jgi:hypothetical protein